MYNYFTRQYIPEDKSELQKQYWIVVVIWLINILIKQKSITNT
jgi:hypothetical protein